MLDQFPSRKTADFITGKHELQLASLTQKFGSLARSTQCCASGTCDSVENDDDDDDDWDSDDDWDNHMRRTDRATNNPNEFDPEILVARYGYIRS